MGFRPKWRNSRGFCPFSHRNFFHNVGCFRIESMFDPSIVRRPTMGWATALAGVLRFLGTLGGAGLVWTRRTFGGFPPAKVGLDAGEGTRCAGTPRRFPTSGFVRLHSAASGDGSRRWHLRPQDSRSRGLSHNEQAEPGLKQRVVFPQDPPRAAKAAGVSPREISAPSLIQATLFGVPL